jgi:hypothetical protein
MHVKLLQAGRLNAASISNGSLKGLRLKKTIQYRGSLLTLIVNLRMMIIQLFP